MEDEAAEAGLSSGEAGEEATMETTVGKYEPCPSSKAGGVNSESGVSVVEEEVSEKNGDGEGVGEKTSKVTSVLAQAGGFVVSFGMRRSW